MRYPADLFKVQRAILGTYHVTDAGSFYSSDDAWVTPNDPTQPAANADAAAAVLPDDAGARARTARRSRCTRRTSRRPAGESQPQRADGLPGGRTADAGDRDYGKLTLLTLPKQDTVPGPGQVQNNFNTDTDGRATSSTCCSGARPRSIRGNLLTLPVGGGLLYVQPVYVQSTSDTSYPLLRKMLVVVR